jgi:hypothetical protein
MFKLLCMAYNTTEALVACFENGAFLNEKSFRSVLEKQDTNLLENGAILFEEAVEASEANVTS